MLSKNVGHYIEDTPPNTHLGQAFRNSMYEMCDIWDGFLQQYLSISEQRLETNFQRSTFREFVVSRHGIYIYIYIYIYGMNELKEDLTEEIKSDEHL